MTGPAKMESRFSQISEPRQRCACCQTRENIRSSNSLVHRYVKGGQKPIVPPFRQVLSDQKELDRTTINAWEDKEFLDAVEATGRKKLIICALWTEACLIFPSLDAMKEGYEVYPVVDAVGGTSLEAHQTALQRIALAGGKLVSWVQLLTELQKGLGTG